MDTVRRLERKQNALSNCFELEFAKSARCSEPFKLFIFNENSSRISMNRESTLSDKEPFIMLKYRISSCHKRHAKEEF